MTNIYRPIRTIYYAKSKAVRSNYATYANRAVLHCVDHMQMNHYGARTAEVFDELTGVLHAIVTRSITGTITIVYKREVAEDTAYPGVCNDH